jgi:cytochrome c-type protein NapB
VSHQDPLRAPLSQRLIVIVTAVVAMGVVLLAIQRASARRPVEVPRAREAIVAPDDPIASEAMVFRTRPGMLAVEPDSRRRPDAHPRTFATYRLLRSYPGAPPRVPHGLTATEFRTNRCNTCHERGGYSQRFGAYAPVNPHPEWVACLQCHATNELLVGLPFPRASPDDACRQCHTGRPARFDEAGLDWRPAAWPTVGVRRPGEVPVIPHDLQTRGNCLSCHMGPGSVAEIRTTHPERSDCRQCHVSAGTRDAEFVRPTSPVPGVVP